MVTVLLALLQAAAPASGPTVTVEGTKPERRICRSVGDSTGSRMGGTRVCRTAAEWKAAQAPGPDQRYTNDSVNTSGYNAGHIPTREPVSAGVR
jgi:hypothetical protein